MISNASTGLEVASQIDVLRPSKCCLPIFVGFIVSAFFALFLEPTLAQKGSKRSTAEPAWKARSELLVLPMPVVNEDARYIYDSKSTAWRSLSFFGMGNREFAKGEPLTIQAILETYHSFRFPNLPMPRPIRSHLESKLWDRVKEIRDRGRTVDEVIHEMRADTLRYASEIARTPSTFMNLRSPHLFGFYLLDKIASTQRSNQILNEMDSRYRDLSVFRFPHERDVVSVASDISNQSLIIQEKRMFTNGDLKKLKQARLEEIREDFRFLKDQLSAGSANYNSSDLERFQVYVERLARLDPDLGWTAREMLEYLQESPSSREQQVCSQPSDSRFLLELEAFTAGDSSL